MSRKGKGLVKSSIFPTDTSCTVIKSDQTWVHIGYSNGVSPDNQKSMNNFLEYFSSIHAYDAI